MRLFAAALTLAAFVLSAAYAAEFRPLSPEEGGAILSAHDEYMAELSPADLSIRLKRADGGSMEDFRRLYAGAARAWTDEERARLDAMVARNRARLDLVAAWLPDEIGFIKATADVEGGLPHTRGAAIVFGAGLPREDSTLDDIFFHELFHVLSRRNAARHDELYALIGFEPCTRIDLPGYLVPRRITNPDAPIDRHVVPIVAGDRYVLPRLMSNSDLYDAARPRFSSYFDLRFVLIERDGRGRCRAVRKGRAPVFVEPDVAAAILRLRAGANTEYFFHPEEILADNFVQLMRGAVDLPDPSVHRRLAEWLRLPEGAPGVAPSNAQDPAPSQD
jgi:hypothetical protein